MQGGCATKGGGEAATAEEREGRERRGEIWLTSGLHRHVASTSAKPGNKTVRCSKMNGFKGWMVKDIRFWSSMAKTKPRQELDGQK